MRFVLALLLLAPGAAMADTAATDAAAPETVAGILAQAKSDCAAIDKGVFSTDADAVTALDLTGDGKPDQLVDAAKFHCSTAESYWSGTGGAQFWIVADGQSWPMEAQAWQVIDWNGSKILMLWENGGACGGDGAQKCVEALVWDDYAKDFNSVRNGGD